MLVVASFLGYAHYRSHRFLTELPKKLGADIQQEANAFTWSQSVKGRTVFTVHAAKETQHKNGTYTLHDVEITVYGQGEEESKRVDHISGKEFELDQSAGIVRAMGEVHLDLQAPEKQEAANEGKEQASENARLIHVKTSGLIYQQKLGTAETDQPIEFEYNGLTGHATGANYNADDGILVLHSDVKVSGLDQGRPILLTATHGELDRTNRQVVLTQAKYVTVNAEEKGQGARQTVEARKATVMLRKDGSAERLIGEGGVFVTAGDGSTMTAQRGEVTLNEANKPQVLTLQGGIKYAADDESRTASGEAGDARIVFDGQGHAQNAILRNAVHLNERLLPQGTAKSGSERDLTADTVQMSLATAEGEKLWMRNAKASGGARLKVTDAAREGTRVSSMRGDVLTANFASVGGRSRLTQVNGDGRTALEQSHDDGVVQASSGDTLKVSFQGAASGTGKDEIASAVQQGHIVLTRRIPVKPAQDGRYELDKATAKTATYDGATQWVTLNGAVEMQSPEGALWADQVMIEQKTGDAKAEGSVKASYQQGAKGQTLHVLSQRADLKKANDMAIFYGATDKPARLWQGASQIEAPVLQFERKAGRLTARGDDAKQGMPVHTVLVSAGADERQKASVAEGASLRRPAVVRIGSGEMVYSDAERAAEFTGGVNVQSADGVMRGRKAIAYLQPAKESKGAGSRGEQDLLGGAVERVVVNGSIEIEQSGRRATGDRLIYTAADGIFVLTGTDTQPPKVVDAARGTVTGRELRFRQQDASVVISNGDASGAGQRVRTETRVKRER